METKRLKHAFLIGLYQNPVYAATLVESLRGERSNIYVHINPLYLDNFKDFVAHYANVDDVQIIHTQPTKWGGVTLLWQMRDLLKIALKDESNGFFHTLTGQDILVKPLRELYQFFDANSMNNYLSYGEDQMQIPQKGYLLGFVNFPFL